MAKNVTLKIDEQILKKCRRIAVEHDKSLSGWITSLLEDVVRKHDDYDKAYLKMQKAALQDLDRGLNLGGGPYYSSRDDIHDR